MYILVKRFTETLQLEKAKNNRLNKKRLKFINAYYYVGFQQWFIFHPCHYDSELIFRTSLFSKQTYSGQKELALFRKSLIKCFERKLRKVRLD